jgi:3-oxoacyl-[acyl-carrier-protein] synthase III
MSYISYYDYYKPEESLSALTILNQVGVATKVKNHLINQGNLRQIAVETELTPHEMLGNLIEKYMQTHMVEDIQYLIFTGDDYWINSSISVPYYLIVKYGMKNATVLALNQGCAGTLHALHLADNLVRNNLRTKVLIAAVSKIDGVKNRYAHPTLLGDGAGILVVEKSGSLKVLDCLMMSDGTNSYENYTHAGQDFETNWFLREQELNLNLNRILTGIIRRNGLKVEEVRLFVPQSINYLTYKMHYQKMNVKGDKFFLRNIPDGGHLGDVDTIRNLKDALTGSPMRKGEKLLPFSLGEVGGNFNFIANLIEVV